MKYRNIIKYLSVGLVTVIAMGCNDEKYKPISNGVYLEEAAPMDKHNQQIETVVVDDGSVIKTLTTRLARPVNEDIQVRFSLDETILDSYNRANNLNYQLLPEEFRTFDETSVIPAGSVSAAPVELSISPFTTPNDELYAIPVRMTVVSGPESIVGNADKMLYLLSSPLKQNSIVMGSGEVHTPFNQEFNGDKWSLEFWFKVNNKTSWKVQNWEEWQGNDEGGVTNARRNKRAQIFTDNSAPIRFDNIMFRYWADGAAKIAPTLQAQAKAFMDSNEWWYPDTWFHLAYTWDQETGTLTLYKNGSVDVSKSGMDEVFKFSEIRLCSGFGWQMEVEFAQIRLWNKTLSENDVKNSMNRSVPVDSEGLIGYWKCDSVDGNRMLDSGPNGFHIDLSRNSKARLSDKVYNFSHPND